MMSNLLSFDRLNISTIVYGINIYASVCSTLNKDYILMPPKVAKTSKESPFFTLMQGTGLIDRVRVPKRSIQKLLRKFVPAAPFFFFGFSSNPYRTTTGYQTEIKLTFKLSLQDYHRISDRN